MSICRAFNICRNKGKATGVIVLMSKEEKYKVSLGVFGGRLFYQFNDVLQCRLYTHGKVGGTVR